MPRNCLVFFLSRRLTRSAIYGSQFFDSHKWPAVLVRKVKGTLRNSRQICMDHCTLLLNHLSNHMHFLETDTLQMPVFRCIWHILWFRTMRYYKHREEPQIASHRAIAAACNTSCECEASFGDAIIGTRSPANVGSRVHKCKGRERNH